MFKVWEHLTSDEMNEYFSLQERFKNTSNDDLEAKTMIDSAISAYVYEAHKRYEEKKNKYCDSCHKKFIPDHYSLEYYGDTDDLYCSNCLSILESQAEMREDFLNMEGE